MKPVSFGSLMAFTTKDYNIQGNAEHPMIRLLTFPFYNNRASHELYKDEYVVRQKPAHPDVVNGTVHNAAQNFSRYLDEKYKDEFRVNNKLVFITEADFFDASGKTQKRFFLTAATAKDEEKIHKILCKSPDYLLARFNKGN